MSKHTTKQRMKRRLIEAIAANDEDEGFEIAVMGEQHKFWTYTHTRLKQILNQCCTKRYSDNTGTYCYDARGKRLMVADDASLKFRRWSSTLPSP